MNSTSRIEHRLLKTTSVSWLSTIIAIVMQLISVPICLSYWGKSGYGAWLALSAAYTIMRTIDGGFTAFVGNKLNILYHKDINEMRRVLSSAILGVLILGVIQIIVLLILYWTNSMSLIIKTDGMSITPKQTLIGLIIMSITWIMTGSYIGILHRFLIPVGMLYQLLWWMMALQVTQYVFLIISAYFQVSILTAAIFFAVVQSCVYISSAFYIKRRLPEYFPWVKNPKFSIAFREIGASIPMSLNGVMQQGGSSALIVLVSGLVNVGAVPVYATLRTLTNLGTTVANMVTAPLLPDIVRFHSTNNWERLLIIHRAHLILITLVINIPLMICYPFANDIFSLWTKHKLVLDYMLLSFLLASVIIFSLNSLLNTFLTGLNHRSYLITSAAIRGILVLLLGWVFILHLGLAGLGLAVLIAEVILLIVNSQLFFRHELGKIGCKSIRLFSVWNWIGFGVPTLFLLVSGIKQGYTLSSYIMTMVLLCISLIYSWRELDGEIKMRIINLVLRKR